MEKKGLSSFHCQKANELSSPSSTVSHSQQCRPLFAFHLCFIRCRQPLACSGQTLNQLQLRNAQPNQLKAEHKILYFSSQQSPPGCSQEWTDVIHGAGLHGNLSEHSLEAYDTFQVILQKYLSGLISSEKNVSVLYSIQKKEAKNQSLLMLYPLTAFSGPAPSPLLKATS